MKCFMEIQLKASVLVINQLTKKCLHIMQRCKYIFTGMVCGC